MTCAKINAFLFTRETALAKETHWKAAFCLQKFAAASLSFCSLKILSLSRGRRSGSQSMRQHFLSMRQCLLVKYFARTSRLVH